MTAAQPHVCGRRRGRPVPRLYLEMRIFTRPWCCGCLSSPALKAILIRLCSHHAKSSNHDCTRTGDFAPADWERRGQRNLILLGWAGLGWAGLENSSHSLGLCRTGALPWLLLLTYTPGPAFISWQCRRVRSIAMGVGRRVWPTHHHRLQSWTTESWCTATVIQREADKPRGLHPPLLTCRLYE